MAKRQKVEEEAQQEEAVTAQISERKLKALIKDCRAAYSDSRAISGAIGQKVRDAVEHDNLDRAVLSIITKLDRLEPEKLAARLESLDYSLEASGLRARAASAPRLAIGENIHEFPAAAAE